MEIPTDWPTDIVDSQIHLFHTTGVEGCIAAMDALGIRAAMVDEFWGYGEDGRRTPGYVLPNGAFRATTPQAEWACSRHPDRFSYLVLVDYQDPLMTAQIQLVADAPHARAVRLGIRNSRPDRVQDLAEGRCRPFFAAAANCGVPVFVITDAKSQLLRQYIEEFSSLVFIFDHVGMARTQAEFDDVLRLGDLKNCALKWCHAEVAFGATRYPFPETAQPLRRALNAFGAERIMWASDFTIRKDQFSWADRLNYVRNSTELTADEKTSILGRTARTLLDWPLVAAAV